MNEKYYNFFKEDPTNQNYKINNTGVVLFTLAGILFILSLMI
jgi:hypothetical protein